MGNTSPTSLVLRYPRYLTTIFLCGPGIVVSRGVGVSCQAFALYPMSFLGSHHCAWDSYVSALRASSTTFPEATTHSHTVPLSSGFSMPLEVLPYHLPKLSFPYIPQKYWLQGAFQFIPGCWTSLGSNSQAKRFQAWLCHLLVASHKSQWLQSTHPAMPRPSTKVPRGNLALVHIWQLCSPTHTHTQRHHG